MIGYMVVLCLVVLVFAIGIALGPYGPQGRDRSPVPPRLDNHQWYLDEAARVLATVRTFDGPGAAARVLSYLRKIDPYVFEELLLMCFLEQGYEIERNRSYSADGGIDGRVRWHGKLYLVQAKRYQSHVDGQDIKRFARIIRSYGAAGGYFCHTGRTGRLARVIAWKDGVRVLSGSRLLALVVPLLGGEIATGKSDAMGFG